jgi:hypothetical protein
VLRGSRWLVLLRPARLVAFAASATFVALLERTTGVR